MVRKKGRKGGWVRRSWWLVLLGSRAKMSKLLKAMNYKKVDAFLMYLVETTTSIVVVVGGGGSASGGCGMGRLYSHPKSSSSSTNLNYYYPTISPPPSRKQKRRQRRNVCVLLWGRLDNVIYKTAPAVAATRGH